MGIKFNKFITKTLKNTNNKNQDIFYDETRKKCLIYLFIIVLIVDFFIFFFICLA